MLAILALVGDLHYLGADVAAVLVHIDLDGDRPHRSSLVALAAGRHVASSWGATLYAGLIAHDPTEKAPVDSTAQVVAGTQVPGIEAIETELARAGADKVVVALTDAPVLPLWAAIGNAWSGVVDHLRPRLVLFGADSPSASELAPRTAARIGARLLVRARLLAGDDVELRDRDGGYARMTDSGAAVALVGRSEPAPVGDDDIDLVVLAMPGGADERVEIAGTSAAELAHYTGALVALGDDAAADAKLTGAAKKLAKLLGAQLIGGTGAKRAIAAGAIVDRTTPLAPELCVLVGGAQLDVAGATSLVKIGSSGGKNVDGALSGPANTSIAELLKRLENA